MKIPKFLDDLSVISKLGDNPGADNGLTAEGLKAKFDEAGLKLQTFLNETLIEKINSLFSLDAPPHEGMNMTGPINMNKNKLGNLADPIDEGDAVNLGYAKKVGNPHNLLDNSNFRNPVNQRGQTSHATTGYTVDRWIKGNEHGTVTVNNEHITLQGGSTGACWFQQKIPHGDSLVGKTLTFAAMDSNGELTVGSKTISNSNHSEFVRKDWGFLFCNAVTNDVLLVSIVVNVGYTKSFVWAALYEGEYTAETLPEYQPKGYGAELAECQRYYCNSWFGVPNGKSELYQIIGSVVNVQTADFLIQFPQTMRIYPTVTYYGTAGRENPNIYITAYAEIASIQTLTRYGLNGAYARASKATDTDTMTWVDRDTIQLHAHWEASADL